MVLQGRGNWWCTFAGQVTSVASANSQSISQASSVTSTAVTQAFSAVSLSPHHTQVCHRVSVKTFADGVHWKDFAAGTVVPEGSSTPQTPS